MSKTEFDLSEKIRETKTFASPILWAEDVKEFIRLLKEEIKDKYADNPSLIQYFNEIIESFAGDKLTK